MKKIIIIFILALFVINFVSAKLTEPQINQIVKEVSSTCQNNYDTPLFRQNLMGLFNNFSIESGAFLPPADFNITGCGNHILRFYSERVFLDGRDISTISQKTDVINENNFIKIGTINLTLFEFSFALISISIISLAVILRIFLSFKKEFRFTFLSKIYSFKIESKNH